MQIRSASYNPVQQVAAGDQISGTQLQWAIDPINGNDAAFGTPEFPLRTMGEFNRRYQGVFVSVAATLQLVGDVTDQPLWLEGTRFNLGASLTVLGTKTLLASGAVVTVVTQLGDGGVGFPFQLTTTGINWLQQPLNAQIKITASSAPGNVNCIGFISSVVDANNVIVGAISTGLTTSGSAGNVTPLANDVLSVSSLSNAYSPQINATALTISQQPIAAFFTNSIAFKDLRFGGGFPLVIGGGAGANFVGCEVPGEAGPGSAFGIGRCSVRSQCVFLACRFTLTQLYTLCCSRSEYSLAYNCVMACDTATKTNRWTLLGGLWSLFRNTHNNAALRSGSGTLVEVTGAVNIRNTTIPCFFEEFSQIWCLAKISGATGNLDSGMRIQSGTGFAWNGAANKPNVTGGTPGTDDIRVGGTGMSYAALGTGYYAAFNNANPNSILNLVGPGGGCWAAQF